MKYKMFTYLLYFKSISGSLRIFANKNRQMQESQSYKYLNLLEIISNVNRIAREKKGVDETLMQIVESLPPHNNMANPVSLRITINNKEYLSREFSVDNICMTSNFIATSGSRGKIDICSILAKTSFSESEKKEHDYFVNNLVKIITNYLNEYEIISSYNHGENKNNPVSKNGPVSSKFLQRFLNKYTYNRDIYHDLMPFKVKEILLISSLYDAYSIESEGRFSEHMLGQYGQLNLTTFPRITGASNIKQAMELLKYKNFELIIYMVGVDKKTPLIICEQIKKTFPFIPIFLLLNNSVETSFFTTNLDEISFIDKIFTWNGDASIFFSMIKLLEDKINVENDTQLGKVRVILLVEDSPVYYSRYLSFLYKVLLEQTKRIIDDVSTDELYKVLRMRARPKILLATNFEEATDIINNYRDYLTCLITDVKFEREGKFDDKAGLKLLDYTRSILKNLPTILQSSESSYSKVADDYNSLFIHKNSDTLYQDFEHFITNFLGFGNFEFKDNAGNIVAIASNMKEFERFLRKIPDESLLFHASRDHFSMWLMARGEIKAASIINLKKVHDFESLKDLRRDLLFLLKEHRNERESGNVFPYEPNIEITEENVYTLAGGSLGGKGRGLAFIDALIHNFNFSKFIPDVKVRTPKTFVIGTHEFEFFLKSNNLATMLLVNNDYDEIKKQFVQGNLSNELSKKLTELLSVIKKPIAVRSSGMFEDSLTQPFAGIFETYLLPNNHPDPKIRLRQAEDAIKLVMASVFSNTAKGYVKAIDYKLEEEKMAVIIQEVVGNQYDNLYYPHISGVAQSYNFYPFAHMKPEEGFAIAAVGLGKYVVEGNKAYRFSPKYPSTEINSTKNQFRNSQVKFYAVDLQKENLNLLDGELAGLSENDISLTEKHGTLNHLASVYNADNNTIYPGISKPGPRIVNFANILKYNYISLAKTIDLVLKLGKDAMGTPVEIEYAVDLKKDSEGKASFYILQIKPLIQAGFDCNIDLKSIKKESIILYSEKGMGNGIINDIVDVIYANIDRFDKSETVEMAREIEEINEYMINQKRKYVLIGPGRWGTRDRWIGIPVKWHMISNARIIVESSLDDYPLDASSGSHFFHNVTSMNVGYFTVQPELLVSYIKYNTLDNQNVIKKGKYFNHIRFQKPLSIMMDGKKRIYLIKQND
ncbi:MAG: pyruvate, phosphate dikinase [Bacteroidetes bacterium]|nr:pyruvate, phosphate dikinase [Bacteroidota bacterium]